MPRRIKERKSLPSLTLPMFEEPGKRHYQKRLKWLLSFLNEDLPNLPPGGFLKIMNEVLLFFYEGRYKPDAEFGTVCIDTLLERKSLKKLQNRVKDCLKDILEGGETCTRDPRPHLIEEELQAKYVVIVEGNRVSIRSKKELTSYRESWFSFDPDTFWPPVFRRRSLADAPIVDEDDIVKKFGKQYDDKNWVFFSAFYDPDVKSSILLTLIPLLEKFPLDCIRQCPDCDKYFTSTRRKESELCRRCLTKRNTYKWREDNREKYNKYQSKLQKARRKQKRKQKEE
ncbi:MAG: hypothetical protein GTN76_07220 [Candidatus Aenigmarchaeota archaeon]|nr:hypothetical protein [Candidatus Aenigmarchaeota archaeon]